VAGKIPYRKETPFIWFLLLSVALNVGVALSGYYFRFPEQKTQPDIELSAHGLEVVREVGTACGNRSRKQSGSYEAWQAHTS